MNLIRIFNMNMNQTVVRSHEASKVTFVPTLSANMVNNIYCSRNTYILAEFSLTYTF